MAQKLLKYELVERLLKLKEKQDELTVQMQCLSQEINALAQPYMPKELKPQPLITMRLNDLPMKGHPTLHPIEMTISGSGISKISFEYCAFSISIPYISFIIPIPLFSLMPLSLHPCLILSPLKQLYYQQPELVCS